MVARLADHPDAVDVVSDWAHLQWFERLGFSRQESLGFVQRRLNRDRLPIALVAFADAAPVGTASLLELQHPSTGASTCCLAGLYVVPAMRRRGIGSLICSRAVNEAAKLRAPTIGLFTGNGERFYARLGWRRRSSAIPPRTGLHDPVTFMELGLGETDARFPPRVPVIPVAPTPLSRLLCQPPSAPPADHASSPGVTHSSSVPCRVQTPWCGG